MFEANMAEPMENQPSDFPARKYSSLVVFFLYPVKMPIAVIPTR